MKAGAPAKIDLRKVLAHAQLPALPQSAIRLLELSQDPENGPAEFAVPIESDPGLTGQVLRFVNSSYFGFSREISSVKLAITLVGIRTIKNFALWNAVFSLMPNPKCGPFELKNLWQDSLRRALFARSVGKHLGMKEAEEPFAAALLQDMAIPLLAREAPGAYVKLLEARDNGRVRLSELERHVFGWTHAEAGAMIARQWNLPNTFAVLIESHLDIKKRLERPTHDAAQIAVALSAHLPATTDSYWDASVFVDYLARAFAGGGPSVAQLLGQVDQEFAEFRPVLKLAKPERSLIEVYELGLAASA